MISLSINLPNHLAEASNKAAKKLGFSRTAFIRQAVIHELEGFEARIEQEAVINSFKAIKKSQQHKTESAEIDNGFSSDLPEEKEEWWNKKNC
jgi:metal-responsive CopG/Arc/MetJ family transcriptional regulator